MKISDQVAYVGLCVGLWTATILVIGVGITDLLTTLIPVPHRGALTVLTYISIYLASVLLTGSIFIMLGWIKNPKAIIKILPDTLRPPETMAVKKFSTWMVIDFSANVSTKILTSSGFKIGRYAANVLAKVTVIITEKKMKLVKVTAEELGFMDIATRRQIYDRASEFGLVPVPAETAPRIRLQYFEQPLGECLLIAMQPVMDTNGFRIFEIENNENGKWLHALNDRPGYFWSTKSQWVFEKATL